MLTPREISPEEDRTRDAVDSERKHNQRAIPAPGDGMSVNVCVQLHLLTYLKKGQQRDLSKCYVALPTCSHFDLYGCKLPHSVCVHF